MVSFDRQMSSGHVVEEARPTYANRTMRQDGWEDLVAGKQSLLAAATVKDP